MRNVFRASDQLKLATLQSGKYPTYYGVDHGSVLCVFLRGGSGCDPFEGDPVFPLSFFFHLVSSEGHTLSLS